MRPGCSARQGRQTRADDSSDRRFQRSGAASAGFGSCRLPERRAAAHEGAHFGSCHTFALPRLRAGTASKWPLGNAFVPRSGCGRPRHHATAAAKFLHSPGSHRFHGIWLRDALPDLGLTVFVQVIHPDARLAPMQLFVCLLGLPF